MKSRWNCGSITCIMCLTCVGSQLSINSSSASSFSGPVQLWKTGEWLARVRGCKPSNYKAGTWNTLGAGQGTTAAPSPHTQTHLWRVILIILISHVRVCVHLEPIQTNCLLKSCFCYFLPALDNFVPPNFAITVGKTEISAPHLGRYTQNSCKWEADSLSGWAMVWHSTVKTDAAAFHRGAAATPNRVQCVRLWRPLAELLQTPAHFQQTD